MFWRQWKITEVSMDHKRRNKINFAFNVFQVRFIIAVLVLSLVVSAFLGYRMFTIEKEKSEILQIQNDNVVQMVQQFDRGLFVFLFMIIVLQSMALAFLIMYLTQRISGPIQRIQKELEHSIKTNTPANLAPVRKNDEFQEFFKILREYIEKFRKQM